MPPPRLLMRSVWSERWVSSLYRRYHRRFSGRFLVAERAGLTLFVDQESIMGRHTMTRGLWEWRQLETFERLIRAALTASRPAHFIDIGSYAGQYSLFFRKTGLFDRVVAFEPDPTNLIELKINRRMNPALPFELNEMALSDRKGEAVLTQAGGGSTLEAIRDTALSVPVRVERLDDLVAFEGCLLAIKIDIEGHELSALKGMAQTFARNDIVLQIEIFPENVEKVSALLAEAGLKQVARVQEDYYYTKS